MNERTSCLILASSTISFLRVVADWECAFNSDVHTSYWRLRQSLYCSRCSDMMSKAWMTAPIVSSRGGLWTDLIPNSADRHEGGERGTEQVPSRADQPTSTVIGRRHYCTVVVTAIMASVVLMILIKTIEEGQEKKGSSRRSGRGEGMMTVHLRPTVWPLQ